MIEAINRCIEECYEEVLNSDNKQLQGLLNKLKNEVGDRSYKNIVKGAIASVISQSLMFYFPEEVIIELICKNLKDVIVRLPELKKSYIMKCSLEGHDEYVYRTIEVPSYISLDELCCAILGSFNAEGCHMYSVDYARKTYFCSAYDDDYRTNIEYADEYTLNDLKLRKDSKMVITYDFGDNYEINVKVEETIHNDFLFELEYMYVLDGEGYGIWEDNHYLLDLYYWNKEQYNQVIEQYDFIDNPLEEEYDFEDNDLYEDMMYFKTIYEDHME